MADVFHFRDGQWELHVATMSNGLRVTVIDGPDSAVVEIRDQAAADLVNQLESWRAGWFREAGRG